MKILFCNIGWMKNYQGETEDDTLTEGGSYNKTATGLEETNYYPIKNHYYGYVYVESQHLDLERIMKSDKIDDNFIDNCCIVWIAKSPTKGRVIVGWYKNARIYREPQHLLNNGEGVRDIIDYWFKANKNDCVLIPAEERNFPYPSGKGFMSTSPYTYADPDLKKYTQNEIEVVENYVQSVRNFINNYGKLPQENIILEEDIVKIKYSNEDATTKTQLVDARLGQGKFRKKLLKLYSKCPVSNVKLDALLKASHIKPWRESNNNERLDQFNGFMLAAHIDALFDKGYISFNDDGSLLVSDFCLDEIDTLHIDKNIKIKIYEESKKYLKWHRERIFIK